MADATTTPAHAPGLLEETVDALLGTLLRLLRSPEQAIELGFPTTAALEVAEALELAIDTARQKASPRPNGATQ